MHAMTKKMVIEHFELLLFARKPAQSGEWGLFRSCRAMLKRRFHMIDGNFLLSSPSGRCCAVIVVQVFTSFAFAESFYLWYLLLLQELWKNNVEAWKGEKNRCCAEESTCDLLPPPKGLWIICLGSQVVSFARFGSKTSMWRFTHAPACAIDISDW